MPPLLDKLVRPESRDETIVALVEAADVHALPVLEALLEGNLYAGPTVLVDREGTLQDALTGAPAQVDRDQLEQVTINNRLRRTLQRAVAALRLFSSSAPERLAAARVLQEDPAPEVLPAVEKALALEKDPPVKEALRATAAILALNSPDAGQTARRGGRAPWRARKAAPGAAAGAGAGPGECALRSRTRSGAWTSRSSARRWSGCSSRG